MNELTQDRDERFWCPLHATIVKSALANQESASNMSEVTQERSRILASIVKSALATHHLLRTTNELAQE